MDGVGWSWIDTWSQSAGQHYHQWYHFVPPYPYIHDIHSYTIPYIQATPLITTINNKSNNRGPNNLISTTTINIQLLNNLIHIHSLTTSL